MTYSDIVMEHRELDDVDATKMALEDAWTELQRVPSYREREMPRCHLCGEANKTLLVPCQGCKKLVCPHCSLHPAVVLTVCDTCVEAVRQAITDRITTAVDLDGGAFDANGY